MTSCPHCHKLIEQNAIQCPYCKQTLKAFGHPGIPLHQAPKNQYLCGQCTYHHDDTCTYPQRPYAQTCTLYHDRKEPLVSTMGSTSHKKTERTFQAWCRRNQGLLIFLSLIIISLTLAFLKAKR